jgi:FixJ family two-component response regulator/DNA-binding MarR family transcriptional regulator
MGSLSNSLSFGSQSHQSDTDDDFADILVVDDDADWVMECNFILGSLGYRSLGATSRQEALAHIFGGRIETVIIDYSMPGCDGLELAQELSEIARLQGRSLRFVLATGHATLEVAVDAIRASVTDFLQKPVTREQLRTTMLRIHGFDIESPMRKTLIGQLSTISAEMQRLARLIGEPGENNDAPEDPRARVADIAFIRQLLRHETKRREISNGSLFGDPAWAMLLDLVVANLENRTVSVSSACIASGAPTTTALRLVNKLVADAILNRIPDNKDGRRDFLVIAPDIQEMLITYLNDLADARAPF